MSPHVATAPTQHHPRHVFKTLCFAAVGLIISPVAQGQDITTGLRGLWKLDETSGTTATDYSGLSANGTYIGAPVLNGSGRFGKAVNFSGGGGTLDRISLPSSVMNAQASVTLSFWYRA